MTLVLEHQPAAGDLQALEVGERLAGVAREQRRQQILDGERAARLRPPSRRQAAQADAAVVGARQHEPRRRRRERGRRQHAVQQQRPQADADLDLRQLEQELAVGPLDPQVDGDQLEHALLAEAQLGAADLDPEGRSGDASACST